MYNKKLKDRHLKRKALKEDQDPLVIDEVPSDDEWIVIQGDDDVDSGSQEDDLGVGDEVNDEVEEGIQGSGSTQQRQKEKRKRVPSQLDTRKKGKEKGLQLVDEEIEWEDLEDDDDEDDRAIRYDDDSMDDPSSGDDDENGGFDEFFKPLDTDDSIFH